MPDSVPARQVRLGNKKVRLMVKNWSKSVAFLSMNTETTVGTLLDHHRNNHRVATCCLSHKTPYRKVNIISSILE